MAQSNTYENATIGNYQEIINVSGELQISGVYKGTQVNQTLVCEPPCIIFIDPVNSNFIAIHDIREVAFLTSLELVKIIKGIS